MYFGVESNIMSFVLDKNLQRCGGAGHTTGDCMVGRPGHQVPPGTGPGIVPPDKWGAPGQVGQVPVSLLLNWLWTLTYSKLKFLTCFNLLCFSWTRSMKVWWQSWVEKLHPQGKCHSHLDLWLLWPIHCSLLGLPDQTKPYKSDRTPQLWQNFTTLTEFHNFDRISQFQQNFHNYDQISTYLEREQFHNYWSTFSMKSRLLPPPNSFLTLIE